MDAHELSLRTYLTVQLQEIICLGPGHVLTWSRGSCSRRTADDSEKMFASAEAFRAAFANLGHDAKHANNLKDWLQVSVQGGMCCHLMVQFVLPWNAARGCKSRADNLFGQHGWTHCQSDERDCLVYYVGQSCDGRQLLDAAENVAAQIASTMRLLWNANTVEDIVLLGARGPRLTRTAAMPFQSHERTETAVPLLRVA